MKKKLLLAPLMAALVACVVLLSGCGGPSVEELITNDLTSQFDEIKNGGDDFLSGLEEASGDEFEQLGIDPKEYAKSYLEGFDYKIGDVTVDEDNLVTVKGPKGTLTQTMRPEMIIKVEGNVIHVGRPSEDKLHKSLHGLTRSLIHDMVVGVTDGFKKELEINGVGYKASKEGNKLVMNLGYSHLVTMEEIEGITIDVPAPNKVVINGIDKQKVGQFAANVRGKRPPEPYKGKGIKYATETIRHKEGKAGGKK